MTLYKTKANLRLDTNGVVMAMCQGWERVSQTGLLKR